MLACGVTLKLRRWLLIGVLCGAWGCASSQPQSYSPPPVTRSKVSAPTKPSTAVQPAPALDAQPTPVRKDEPTTPEIWYRGLSGVHWVVETRERGRFVGLEDGSLWEISPVYLTDTMMWLVGQKIKVTETADPRYRYNLANRNKNTTVEAKLVSTRESR